MGKDPAMFVGPALPAAVVILLAGVLVLIVGRTVAQSGTRRPRSGRTKDGLTA